MTINEHIIKISGGTYIDHELNTEKTQKIVGELQIYSKEFRDNQDGTHNLVYKAKFVGETALSEGNGVILSKDKTSSSKKLRWAVRQIYDQGDYPIEFDEFYARCMQKITFWLPDVMQFLKTKE